MARYYHVIKKQGMWHLYAGNAVTSLMAEPDQGVVTRAARALARHDGARVVVHKDPGREIGPVETRQRGEIAGRHGVSVPPATGDKLRLI